MNLHTESGPREEGIEFEPTSVTFEDSRFGQSEGVLEVQPIRRRFEGEGVDPPCEKNY